MAKGKNLKTTITLEGKVADSLRRAFDEVDKKTKKTESIFSKFGGFAASAGKVAAAGFAAAGAAATAFAAKSVQTGMAFDKSMSQVAATMGLSMDEMAKKTGEVDTAFGHFEGNLRDFAQYMGKNTAFSASEAADALNYMALAGYDAQTSMNMLPNVLNLAAAGAMDLAAASDMITDTQTAMGMSLERTSLMVDEMAKAASTGNTSVQQLGEAFLVVGGLAQELSGGMISLGNDMAAEVDGAQELEIALTAMANAGIKGAEAGTHMRNMLLKLSDPSKDGAMALESMGVSVFDAEGKMRSLANIFYDLNTAMGTMTQEQKLSTIGDLFNSRDIASSEALLNAVSQNWNEIGASILDAKWKLDDVASAMRDTDIDWSKYKYPVEEIGAEIRGHLTTMEMTSEETAKAIAEDYGISLTDALKAVQAVESGMEGSMGAAAQMAATQLDNLSGDITIFKSAFEGLQITVSDALSPMLRDFVQFGTNTLSAITDGMKEGGLEGAGAIIQQMFIDGFNDAVSWLNSEAPGIIAGVLSNVFGMDEVEASGMVSAGFSMANNMISGFQEALQGIIPMVTSTFDVLGKFVMPTIRGIGPLFSGVFSTAASYISMLLSSIKRISPYITSFNNSVAPAFQAAGEMIYGIFEAVGNVLTNNVSPAIETIGSAMTSGLEQILAAAAPIIDRVSAFYSEYFPIIGPFFEKIIEDAGILFQNYLIPIGEWLINNLARDISMAISFAGAAFDTILSFVEPILPGIIQTFGGIIDFITGVFTGDWQKAWEGVKGIFEGIWNSLTGIVKGVITGIVKGINHVISGINGMISTVGADKVAEFLGFSGKIATIPLPQFAAGATVTSPTLAMVGDGGEPETIIPHNNSARSRELLNEAARGVLGAGASVTAGNTDNSRTYNITFSPIIQGAGLTDKDLQDSFEKFKRMMTQYMAEQDREVFA